MTRPVVIFGQSSGQLAEASAQIDYVDQPLNIDRIELGSREWSARLDVTFVDEDGIRRFPCGGSAKPAASSKTPSQSRPSPHPSPVETRQQRRAAERALPKRNRTRGYQVGERRP